MEGLPRKWRDALPQGFTVRWGQAHMLEKLAAGGDLIAISGTGSGKGICFQLPAVAAALEAQAISIGPPSSCLR